MMDCYNSDVWNIIELRRRVRAQCVLDAKSAPAPCEYEGDGVDASTPSQWAVKI